MTDKQIFSDLVDANSQMLYRVARTILPSDEDCKDALQECVLKAWASRNKLKDHRLFSTWITRIVINECRNIQRKQFKYTLMEEVPAAYGPGIHDPDPDMRAVLESLPEHLRLPVVLHYVEGYSIKEIASMLRVPLTTVKGRLFKARNAMRRELKEEEG